MAPGYYPFPPGCLRPAASGPPLARPLEPLATLKSRPNRA